MPLNQKILKMLPALFLIFFVVLFTNISEQLLNEKLQVEMRSETSTFFALVLTVILLSLGSVFIQEAVFLAYIEKLQPQNKYSMSSRLIDLIRETLKAIGSASLWMYVFIVPGLMRWVQYSLLPFVVFLNPEYQSGEREALSLSRQLIKTKAFRFYGVWLFFNLLIPLLLSFFTADWESFRQTPISATILSFAEGLIFWFWMLILWHIFEKRSGIPITKPVS
jgi:hypothetical protein